MNIGDDIYIDGNVHMKAVQRRVIPAVSNAFIDGGVLTENAQLNFPQPTGTLNRLLLDPDIDHIKFGFKGEITPGVRYNTAVRALGCETTGVDLINFAPSSTLIIDQANLCIDTLVGTLSFGKIDQVFGKSAFDTLGYSGAGAVKAHSNLGATIDFTSLLPEALDLKLGAQFLTKDYQSTTRLTNFDTANNNKLAYQAAAEVDLKDIISLPLCINASYLTEAVSEVWTANTNLSSAPSTISTNIRMYDIGAKIQTESTTLAAGISSGTNSGMSNINQGNRFGGGGISSKWVKINTGLFQQSGTPVLLEADFGQSKSSNTGITISADNTSYGTGLNVSVLHNVTLGFGYRTYASSNLNGTDKATDISLNLRGKW